MPSFRLNALSRATRLWVAGLGTAVLLPLSGLALASEESANATQSRSENVISGHFINIQALNNNPNQRSTSEVGTELLLQETGMRIRSLIPEQNDTFKDLKVMTGQLEGRARSLNAPGEMILVTRGDGSFIALLPDAGAIIRGHASGEQSMIRSEDRLGQPGGGSDSEEISIEETVHELETLSGQRSLQLNRNAQGETVIDVLAGFSQVAVNYIGDHEAYALGQIATVNRALKQSQVQGVRLRLVGTQVIPGDYPITASSDGTLGQVSTLFAEGMKRYSPDLVAAFVKGTPGVDTALAWGYVGGRYTVNAISSSAAFRHEIGHNAGGHHCSDGSSYKFGHNNGTVGSILCGNHIGYYSNPDVKDIRGVPVGDARTANMARVWRENAAKMSAYSPAVVPLGEEQASKILEQKIDLEAKQWRYFPIDVAPGTERLVFMVTNGQRTEYTGNTQLLIKYGTQPSLSAYDYRSQENSGPSLAVNTPRAGRWYLALRTNNNKTASDLVLEGFSYAQRSETAQARYLKLVATSSVDGKDNASVAELLLADAKGQSLPRDSWRIHSTSSAGTGLVMGDQAIDGNPKTYWSSAANARYPHEIIIDLGAERRFSQLHYLPRQDAGQTGNIKGYQVYGSNSPSGAWDLLADGEFNADNEVKAASLKPVEAGKSPIAVISGKTEANAGDKIVLDASASSDPQGNALSFAWEASPKLDFSFDGSSVSFIAPELAEDTRYRFTLTLSNGKLSSTRTHEIRVKGKAATSSCKAEWKVGGIYVTNDVVQWKSRQYQARWWTSGSEPGNPAFTGPDGGGKVWRDLGPCQGGGDKPTEPPVETLKPPVAIIGGATEAKPGEMVYLNATASSDPAGLNLSYSWKVSPSVGFEAAGTLMKFVAPKVDQDVIYRVSLTVSNGKQSATREHNVKVMADAPAVVKPPVAAISGAVQAKGGESVILDASGSSDPAGLALSYRWSVTPNVAFQASGAKLSFIAPKQDKDTSYRFSLTLDNGKHSVIRDHSVMVLAEEPIPPAGCQGPWSAGAIYVTGNKVSHDGRYYIARWWTRGTQPNSSTVGPDNSGKVWRDGGPCN
ncbi:discoidin domain-containing protein [Pseudomonas sp. Fl5BN2]|uniref:discoidin domain-containing protein n=1 Tax=Pseudomonas sp. Fl5BN2 TaxID=2697652 RepID=UPI002114C464|nr:discoidin domain-containing protein [Pseudomonas sp. Fl5BN2]